MESITQNTLFYGDNLNILLEYIPNKSIDLIYLDPPFNSNRNYNVLFRDESGQDSQAQVTAFEDTWHWDRSAEDTYLGLVTDSSPQVSKMIGALREFIGENQMMAYLVMMTARLIELHRVLKDTGSLYLHCDPTASHYLKIVLDTIFGMQNFRNEITWKRQSAHSDAKYKFSDIADIILFYAKSKQTKFNPQYGEYNPDYVSKFYRHDDNDGLGPYRLSDMTSPNPRPNMMYEWMGFPYPAKGWRYQLETMKKLHDEGRIWYPKKEDGAFDTSKRPRLKRYFEEQKGSIITCVWTDIQPLHSVAAETLGYPTQKPLALLERIISASSNEGDWILDPFAGCGTAIAAAQKLNRQWIGIDITHLAISLLKYRLRDMQQEVDAVKIGKNYQVIGEPEDISGARQLAKDDPYQFQWWANGLVEAKPLGGDSGSKKGKKGADRGIDGVISFVDDTTGKPKQVLIQVKSGKVGSKDIRDLVGTIDREKAAIGVFITLNESTREMNKEAVSAGHYHSEGWNISYPRIQILTIEALLNNAIVNMPPIHATFRQAKKEKKKGLAQSPLGLD